MLQLNAEQLELLETDTQKFQEYFIEDRACYKSISLNAIKTNNERLQLLVQQLIIGRPVEPILQNYPKLANWIEQLRIFTELPFSKKLLNVVYKLPTYNIFVSAHYNLLLAEKAKAVAVIWSISNYIPPFEILRNSWRTQLSLFILSEIEQVLPGNVYITYFFLSTQGSPTVYQVYYSQEQHNNFKKRLEKTLNKLANWISTEQLQLNRA